VALVAEEEAEYLGDGEDHLAVGNIQQKLFSQPFAPFLPSLSMTRGTETSGFATEGQEAFLPAVRTPNPGKPAHRVAAVQILLHHFLNHRTKIAILSLKPGFILKEELPKIMKKYLVEDSAFWMTLTIDPCHGRVSDSRNKPKCRKPSH